jgi:hypothetical protein
MTTHRTLIAALLDRSGSMETIRTDTESGFNAFIAEQARQPGEARVTLAQFDNSYELVYSAVPIAEVPRLRLVPRGSTALLDGIGRLVSATAAQIAQAPAHKRPDQVIILVLTDGYENASTEWTLPEVRKLVNRYREHNDWQFIFLGASLDAIAVAQGMGFAPSASLAYDADADGVQASFAAAADYASRLRAQPAGSPPPPGFSPSDRARSASKWFRT